MKIEHYRREFNKQRKNTMELIKRKCTKWCQTVGVMVNETITTM